MTTTTPITDLDFDGIKTAIIAYIKNNPTFTDYDFTGSTLNAIINILAYNTHANAFLASMLHAEGFLDSAQKRGSVVSKAKELGYTPRSVSCSTAFVDVSAVGASGTLLVQRGTTFTASNDNGSYNFLVADDVSSVPDGVNQKLSNIKLMNGTRVINSVLIDSSSNIRSIVTIPNMDVDMSTLRVYVRDSVSSLEQTEYVYAESAYDLGSTSKIFFVQESYDGYAQIFFGSNVLGFQPVDGAVVTLDYFVSTEKSDADNCLTFAYGGAFGTSTSHTVTTVQSSFGGSDKESTDSIKINSKKSYSARNRIVSVPDYELVLSNKFSFIKSASVWGGEDNKPPVYGKVFASIQPVSGYIITDAVKRDVIVPTLRKTGVLTITPEIVDPSYVFLSFLTKLKFNKSKTSSTQQLVEAAVKNQVKSYIEKISAFNTDYLNSDLSALIKQVDPGIVSVNISKNVSFTVKPLIAVSTNYTKDIANRIVEGTVVSTKFTVINGNGVSNVTIKEIPGRTQNITQSDGTTIQLASLGTYTDTGELVAEIGTVNLTTGLFTIAINVLAYISSSRFIEISFRLVNEDITTVRNQILDLNSVKEDTAIGLLDNNRVITEIYTK